MDPLRDFYYLIAPNSHMVANAILLAIAVSMANY